MNPGQSIEFLILFDGAILQAEYITEGDLLAKNVVNDQQLKEINLGKRIEIDSVPYLFIISLTSAPEKQPNPFKPDWNNLAYTGGVMFIFALFLGMLFSLPPDARTLSLDNFVLNHPILIKAPLEKEEFIPDWLKKKDDPIESNVKIGPTIAKTDARNKSTYIIKNKSGDSKMAKVFAEDAAKKAGILGIMSQMEGAQLASIFGRDSALGAGSEDAMNNLIGTQVGDVYGMGGPGLVGGGRGGSMGEGLIGSGALGTIGKAGGNPNGSGRWHNAQNLGKRHAKEPEVYLSTAVVRGSLDKEIVRRVIRRHINEIKFCYEKGLAKKPDLFGRVMIQFTIGTAGMVMAAAIQQSSVGNTEVEGCITSAVRRWEFPKPQGVVVVSYPFVLRAAGEDN